MCALRQQLTLARCSVVELFEMAYLFALWEKPAADLTLQSLAVQLDWTACTCACKHRKEGELIP